MNRRTVLWAAPAVALAVSAPAYATSNVTPELVCTPKGNRSQRHGGHGRRWDYHVDPGCVAVLASSLRSGNRLNWPFSMSAIYRSLNRSCRATGV